MTSSPSQISYKSKNAGNLVLFSFPTLVRTYAKIHFFLTDLLMVLVGIVLTIQKLILFMQFSGGTVLFLAGGINIIFFQLVLDQFASLRLR